MIIGQFFNGSGLGNMLHRYVATRVRATDLGVPFGMIYIDDSAGKEQGFKGQSFMNIDWGVEPYPMPNHYFNEKCVRDDNGVDIRSYDPEFNFIEDNTIIEGEFQDSRYWEHREKEINEWLKVEPLDMPEDLCVIGFRGGEFSVYPDLFLTKDYWDEGIKMMREINPNMRFQVHTDDKPLAQQFFPDFEVIHDIGINWRSMRFARYAIIANSSFFILPRWLRQGKLDGAVTVSPRFWGRRNVGVWSMNQNFYKRFLYI